MVAVGLSPRTTAKQAIRSRGATPELSNRTVVFKRRSASPDPNTPLFPWTEVHGYHHGLAPRGPKREAFYERGGICSRHSEYVHRSNPIDTILRLRRRLARISYSLSSPYFAHTGKPEDGRRFSLSQGAPGERDGVEREASRSNKSGVCAIAQVVHVRGAISLLH